MLTCLKRRLRVLFALLILAPASGAGAEEVGRIEKQNLFTAGGQGYAMYRIPGLVVTRRGTLLAYCEARRAGGSDWGAIDIVLRRSADAGATWSPQRVAARVEGPIEPNPAALAQNLAGGKQGVTYNNAVAIADHETGGVHLLFCVEYMRCFYMHSTDDGASFSTPVEITAALDALRDVYDWKVLAVGPGHGIQLTHGEHKGRLIAPVWLSLGTGGHAHRPSVTTTIYSDDRGASWQAGEIALPDEPPLKNPNETAVVQLADGRVMLNARTESAAHRRAVTTSADGASGWTPARFDEQLLEPICMASIVRLTRRPVDDRNRILFSNPDALDPRPGQTAEPGQGRMRKKVTVKLSYDEGATWPVSRPIEPGVSGYSDLAVGPDGMIHCLYERGGVGDDAYRTAYLTLATFDLAWLTRGADVIAPSATDK